MQAIRVRVPAWAIFFIHFNFSINDHPKYKRTGFHFKLINKNKLFDNLEIRNYLNGSLDYCVVLFNSLMDSFCY